MQIAIDKFGRILIPKKIRDHLGLKPGSQVQVLEQNHEILLKLIERKTLLEHQHNVLVFMGEASGDIESAIANEREDRFKDYF